MPALASDQRAQYLEKFKAISAGSVEDQTQAFLKSFIFALGNSWKDVLKISNDFTKYCKDGGEGRMDLNPVQAADFLQKHGLTRTASQRTAEIKDIDLDFDGRTCMIEYLLLHYKAMILREYYKRTGEQETEDLSGGAIGVTGVGDKLLDQLFTAAVGIDPEIEEAIEELMNKKRAKMDHVKSLEDLAEKGGVKGLAAKNELEQLNQEDQTEMNRMEITLNAARRRAALGSGEIALQKKQKEEEAAAKKKMAESRERLAAKAALFDKK